MHAILSFFSLPLPLPRSSNWPSLCGRPPHKHRGHGVWPGNRQAPGEQLRAQRPAGRCRCDEIPCQHTTEVHWGTFHSRSALASFPTSLSGLPCSHSQSSPSFFPCLPWPHLQDSLWLISNSIFFQLALSLFQVFPTPFIAHMWKHLLDESQVQC